MAGRVTFSIEYFVENEAYFPEVAGRLKDLRVPFQSIIDKWAEGNKRKFSASQGRESSGAEIDPDVFWKHLVPSTMRQKRRKGAPDWIMVETGALMEQETDPQGFWRAVTMQEAVFGMPHGFEEEIKVRYNWEKRQVIFLSIDDQRMIDHEIKNYLELGENYQELLFAKGMQRVNVRKSIAQMDAEFASLSMPAYSGSETGDMSE